MHRLLIQRDLPQCEVALILAGHANATHNGTRAIPKTMLHRHLESSWDYVMPSVSIRITAYRFCTG